MRWERGKAALKTGLFERPSQCRPCAVIWSVLTELSRGMEKIIRRNVWGALKRSGPRDWPMGARPAERRANFFLMNSAACSTMQSDCQDWTHIWSVFGGSKWQDQFCLERKGGGGVGRRWLLLAPPLFYFISFGCSWLVGRKHINMIWLSRLQFLTTCSDWPSRWTVKFWFISLYWYCFVWINSNYAQTQATLVITAVPLHYSASKLSHCLTSPAN